MPNTLVHFEIPADDVPQLQDFYSGLFGWKIEGVPQMDYWFVHTVGQGEPGVNGGLMARQHPGQQIIIYIGVDSVDQYARRLEELGGSIVVPKQPIPQIGYFAIGQDPQGNVFGLFQDDPHAQ